MNIKIDWYIHVSTFDLLVNVRNALIYCHSIVSYRIGLLVHLHTFLKEEIMTTNSRVKSTNYKCLFGDSYHQVL